VEEDFTRILAEIGAKYLEAEAGESRANEFFRGLHLEELALARACAAGSDAAWELFLTRYRDKLYDAGRAITREDSSARELADSLYANLYGTHSRDGQRVSKLAYYNGRGSLEGWLRTTLAQEHVNSLRRQKHLVSLEEKQDGGEQFAASNPPPAVAPDERLAQATDEALAALTGEERLIIASYFLDDRTLAETARLVGVHESTISRRVEKIAVALRKNVVAGLLRRGMSHGQAEEALDADVRDVAVDVRARLTQAPKNPPFLREGSS
jgi:RNA polymerase sigma-70 factor (ECF subfamily)